MSSTVNLSNSTINNLGASFVDILEGQSHLYGKSGLKGVSESSTTLIAPFDTARGRVETIPSDVFEHEDYGSGTVVPDFTPRTVAGDQNSTYSMVNVTSTADQVNVGGGVTWNALSAEVVETSRDRGDLSIETSIMSPGREETEESESFENFSFITNASINKSSWNDSKAAADKEEEAESKTPGLAFQTAAEAGESINATDVDSFANLNPDPVIGNQERVTDSAGKSRTFVTAMNNLGFTSPMANSTSEFQSVHEENLGKTSEACGTHMNPSHAVALACNDMGFTSPVSNESSDFQSVYAEQTGKFDACVAGTIPESEACLETEMSARVVASLKSDIVAGNPSLSATKCEVHERIIPSPLQMLKHTRLMPNKRYLYHLANSAMSHLRLENIKILPNATSKRKVLVPWVVTDCLSPRLEAVDESESEDLDLHPFRRPLHTPNSRQKIDSTHMSEQLYNGDPAEIPLPACASNRNLQIIDGPKGSEVATGTKCIIAEELSTAQKCASPEKLIEGSNTLVSVDLDYCSKQVLVGSLNDLEHFSSGISGSGFDSSDIKNDTTFSGDQTLHTNLRRTRASALHPEMHGDSISRAEENRATRKQKSSTMGRFFTLLSKKNKRTKSETRNKANTMPKTHEVEAFGDRLVSPQSYSQPSRRSHSIFSRKTKSASQSKSRTGTMQYKSRDIDDMVQSLYDKFQSDTEFQMMITNFRVRAKLCRPKKKAEVDMQRDMKLSCGNTTALFSDYYPQLKLMKNKRKQKEVVNKVLGRGSHSKELINEIVLVDAFRPPIYH